DRLVEKRSDYEAQTDLESSPRHAGRDSRERCRVWGLLVRTEQEDGRPLARGAYDLEPPTDARDTLAHAHQSIACVSTCAEAATFIRDLDHEGLGREVHADPADRRARMLANVRKRLAHDLVHDLALGGWKDVLSSAARDLDPDRVQAGKFIRLAAQLTHQAFRTNRFRTQLGQGVAHVLQHSFEDPENVEQRLFGISAM